MFQNESPSIIILEVHDLIDEEKKRCWTFCHDYWLGLGKTNVFWYIIAIQDGITLEGT